MFLTEAVEHESFSLLGSRFHAGDAHGKRAVTDPFHSL